MPRDELAALADRLMIDFVQMNAFADDPLLLEEGDGVRVRDHTGQWYIDGISGVFVSSLGHKNQKVIEAATRQLNTLAFHAPLISTNPPAVRLADLLIQVAPPGYSTVKLSSGGSEATEVAMKIARQYHVQTGHPRKYKVISHYQGYHGGTGSALGATGRTSWRSLFEPLSPAFIHVHPPFTLAAESETSVDAVSELSARLVEQTMLAEDPDTVSAFITEPLMMSAGVHLLPRAYAQRLREICDRHNVLLIFDEVITGFGRLGEWFGANLLGVTPDLLCVAKGISGGYAPLSATLIRKHIADAFWGPEENAIQLRAGYTYGGNPVGAAVGLAAIGEIRERDLVGNARRMGERLRGGLDRIRAAHVSISEVRGVGLLYGVMFNRALNERVGPRVARRARSEGLLIREGPNMLVIAPPLVVTSDDVDELLARLERAIGAVEAELGVAEAEPALV